MSDHKNSDLDYIDMLARPDLCHLKIGEQRIDVTPEEAKAVALLLAGYADLRWKAVGSGYPEPIEPGEDVGSPPTKSLPPGLWARPLGVDQPKPEHRFSDHHRQIIEMEPPDSEIRRDRR